MHQRVMQTRQAALDFQNAKGLASPQGAVETLGGIIGRLEAQISELKGKREAMLGYLNPKTPDLAQIDLQITAFEKQAALEKARLASPAGQTLNRTLEEYQRLQMEAEFVQAVYSNALTALEKGRIEATRTLKNVSILQSPTMPQYPMEPRRIYNIFLFALSMMVLSGIVHLLVVIIREHKD
jgi:capsular polysaccharide transport system permease protein